MIKLEGTDFQIAVWKELLKIPAGSTKTYKEIAVAIGKPNSSSSLIPLAISSASPQENPAALLALFDVVSISLKDFMFKNVIYIPTVHHNLLDRSEVVLLETCIF